MTSSTTHALPYSPARRPHRWLRRTRFTLLLLIALAIASYFLSYYRGDQLILRIPLHTDIRLASERGTFYIEYQHYPFPANTYPDLEWQTSTARGAFNTVGRFPFWGVARALSLGPGTSWSRTAFSYFYPLLCLTIFYLLTFSFPTRKALIAEQ